MPESVRTSIYIPVKLKEKLEQIAARERRSTNNVLVVLLEEALNARRISPSAPEPGGPFRELVELAPDQKGE